MTKNVALHGKRPEPMFVAPFADHLDEAIGDAVDELVVDELLAPDLQRDVVVVVLGREAPRDDAAEHHGDGGHVAGVAAALVHEARQVDDDGAVREGI